MYRYGLTLTVVSMLLCLSGESTAQCTLGWKSGAEVPGLNFNGYTASSWDSDGVGPQAPVLVIGGAYTMAGSTPANYIAAWDNLAWQALGSGIGGPPLFPYVSSLLDRNDVLYAGGRFTSAGGSGANRIAGWNGSTWFPLSTGMAGDDLTDVYALAVFNDELIAGGYFISAGGGSNTTDIARWNGTRWRSLGTGIGGPVRALTLFNNELIAAGDFTNASGVSANRIASWNGTTWQALGSGMDDNVYALAVYNNELIAAGRFTMAGGVSASRIARWNGTSWQPLAGGMSDSVLALTVYNNELIAGGAFASPGQNPKYIARWNGSTWEKIGSGMNGIVNALEHHQSELIAAGQFTTAGGNPSSYWARWGPSCPTGDMNCDQVVNAGDIGLFVTALLDAASLTECTRVVADMNFDGLNNTADIDDFVAALLGA